MNRKKDFQKIIESIGKTNTFKTTRALAVKGDSLQVLKNIPDHSISLILTDPPYHSTKKKNLWRYSFSRR